MHLLFVWCETRYKKYSSIQHFPIQRDDNVITWKQVLWIHQGVRLVFYNYDAVKSHNVKLPQNV